MQEVGGWQDDGYTRDPQGLSKQQYREALQQQLAEQHHQLGHRAGRGMDDGVFQLDGGPAQGQAHPQALRKVSAQELWLASRPWGLSPVSPRCRQQTCGLVNRCCVVAV